MWPRSARHREARPEDAILHINAADEEKRNEVLTELANQKLNVAVLLHSLAFGR